MTDWKASDGRRRKCLYSHTCYFIISIQGPNLTYFIHPHRDLPTTQKKRVLLLCQDRLAYKYDPLGEWVDGSYAEGAG
jgi:hypothetical protein